MPKNNFITNTVNLLVNGFRDRSGILEEPSENMRVKIDKTGAQSVVYSFDKSQKGGNPAKDLFPFYNTIKGAHYMCDYIVFAQQAGKTYVLLVELKKGTSQAGPQLRAGKLFAAFVVETYNRVYKQKISPVIRMVSVHNVKIIKKGTTKMKEVTYDSEGFFDFKGNRFCIQEFLK